MDYIAAGNVMVDQIVFADGSVSDVHVGGPAFFALCGIRTWTENCKLVSNVGADFYDYYGRWFEQNGADRSGVTIKSQHTSYHFLNYYPDGSYGYASKYEPGYASQNLGYLKTSPEDLGRHTAGARGVYIAQNTDSVVWEGFGALRRRDGFKLMWEGELRPTGELDPQDYIRCMRHADAFSLNLNEAATLFKTPLVLERELVALCRDSFPVDLVFLRAGERGSYVIAAGESYFVPSAAHLGVADPTGCGNCSTGAAMFAYAEGNDPLMIGVMANVSASFNLAQFGVYPLFDGAAMQSAQALANELYRAHKLGASRGR